jgi:AcrR family transcriptional regulator
MPVFAPQMRAKLAESAFELFAQQGIKNVNLDQVAAQAGVTKGSLYWHYKSKKEVVLAACAFYYRRWQQRAHAEISLDSNPLRQLERVLRYSVQSCLFDRANRVFTTEVFALSLQDEDIRAGWAQFYDTVRELMITLVQAACAKDQLYVADPKCAVDWMLATIEGIKQRASFEPEICTPDEREVLVRGLLRIVATASQNPANATALSR